MENLTECRICNSTNDEWWCCHEIFGVLCQECRLKYNLRLFAVTQKAADEEINNIKQEEIMNAKFKADTVYVRRDEIIADDDLELVYAKKIMDEWGEHCVVAILSPESKKQNDKFVREVTCYTFHPKGEEELLEQEENV